MEPPEIAKKSVLLESLSLPEHNIQVQGYDWSRGVDYNAILKCYRQTGLQSTNFAKAVDSINQMLRKRDEVLEEDETDDYEEDDFIKRKNSCTIFFGYTSNMVSCGLRDTIKFLVKNKMIDCLVTSAGGVEEDLIKCLAPTYIGSFELLGKDLREKGINRIGNLLVPNENYCLFENWVMPILDEMLNDQKNLEIRWTPSKMIERLGLRIDNEESICYWAAKNKIPIFCPALTDGSLGDMMYFHSFRNPGLVCDILSDLGRINNMAMKAKSSGIISIGSGVVKHHMCKANVVRDGADYAVYLNTAPEFDGSDSGAEPDESIACGKIKPEANAVKIHGEATLILPLIVGETFAKHLLENKKVK